MALQPTRPAPSARPGSIRPVLRAERRRRRGSVWRDHTGRVQLLRRGLPALMGVLVLILIGWIVVRAVLSSMSQHAAVGGDVRMVSPRFFGRDNRGRPYQVTAITATRDGRDPNQVVLDRPVFILQTGWPKPTTVQALGGLYRDDTKKLLLTGQAVLEDSQGYRFDSERALIDTITGVTTGETAVTGVGDLGAISASSYGVYDHGAKVVFTGNVRAHLNNNRGQPPSGQP